MIVKHLHNAGEISVSVFSIYDENDVTID